MAQIHEDFTRFLESIYFTQNALLAEASTTMDLVRGDFHAENLVRTLHQDNQLWHLQGYQEIPKGERLEWNDIKERGDWVLIKGRLGWAALRGRRDRYTVYASTDLGVEETTFSRSSDAAALLKTEIGTITNIFRGAHAGNDKVSQIQSKRRDLKRMPVAGQVRNAEDLYRRFKPLIGKYLISAEAELRSVVNNLMKAGRYGERAGNTINRLRSLQMVHEKFTDGENIMNYVSPALNSASSLAAAHYYPDMEGSLERHYSSGIRHTNSAAILKLYADISAGDNAKLGGVMAYFKRELMGMRT